MNSEHNLAHLASQHHTSEYNRAKFGPHGCPVPYIPLSLHLPDHFRNLRSRQLTNTQAQSWWLSTPHPQPFSIQDEIFAAMSEPLAPPFKYSPTIKTSHSHPINVSPIIPPELLALISSHALLTSVSKHSPTLLDIPSSFTLHRLLDIQDMRVHHLPFSNLAPRAPIPKQLEPAVGHFRTLSSVSNVIHPAINSGMQAVHIENLSRDDRTSYTPFISTVSVSLRVTPASIPDLPVSQLINSQTTPRLSLAPTPAAHAKCLQNPLPVLCGDQTPPAHSPPTIGNLYLSSCPGKKVRLDGPVKGRSGVCRDLASDLRRMKDLGTGCIVCCLDDEELEFLGAPWPEYVFGARQHGIDVLRIPIPEGLAPLSTSQLDGHLTSLINRYTLQGVPVLVHCRGGVGRAGLVASCWLIRLGLCGLAGHTYPNSSDMASGQDAVALVERVISLVRRRRSIKAVETYEQVKFLVDYVNYIQQELVPS